MFPPLQPDLSNLLKIGNKKNIEPEIRHGEVELTVGEEVERIELFR